MEWSERAGVAGSGKYAERGGGRSHDNDGYDATVHLRMNCWVLSAPGRSMSTRACSGVSYGDNSRGGAMAGGGELLGLAAKLVREGNRARGERENALEFT